MYCTNCGTALVDGAKFCTKCGSQTAAAPVAQTSATYAVPQQTVVSAGEIKIKQEKSKRPLGVLLLVVSILMLFVFPIAAALLFVDYSESLALLPLIFIIGYVACIIGIVAAIALIRTGRLKRYRQVIKLTREREHYLNTLSAYLSRQGYTLDSSDGSYVWRQGSGWISMPKFVELFFSDDSVILDAYMKTAPLPGVYVGEMGTYGVPGETLKLVADTAVRQMLG